MPRKVSVPLPGPMFSEPVFDEKGIPTPDPTTFRTPHDPNKDKQIYNQFQKLMSQDTVSFPASRGKPDDLFSLESALGSQGSSDVADILKSGKIVFHAIGDSGATSTGISRSHSKLANELHVADHLTNDFHLSSGADRPSFLFHLGDIVYNFGESQYYYDQFYEPYRNYPCPIFAIPGNHDSFVVPGTPVANVPLKTFMNNFCSPKPVLTKEAGSLHRTAMTQPGVYFTLDAPFVRIIGLFSNALEDPGVISSQKSQHAKWPNVPDYQLAFLTAQLKRIKTEKYLGAVIIAVHHPPFSYAPQKTGATGHHGFNVTMLQEIDTICKNQGIYPHAIISGHAHNYQRFTRSMNFNGKDYTVPFIVTGNGGHNVQSVVQSRGGVSAPEPARGAKVDYLDINPVIKTTGLTLDNYDDQNYGYMRVTVDSKHLRFESHSIGNTTSPQKIDTVMVDIANHKIV